MSGEREPPDTGRPAGRAHFRRSPRPGRRVPIRYAVVGDQGPGALVASFTVNVGVGGAFIENDAPPPPGTRLLVEVDVPPAGTLLALRGEVRWIGTCDDGSVRGMGVRFLELDEQAYQMLEDWLGSFTDTLDFDEAL